MPDIFVNSKPSDDIGQNNVAQDALDMNPQTPVSPQPTPIPVQPSVPPVSNAQKHAMRRDSESLPGHTHNMLASFFYYPDRIDFVNKDPQEVIILMVRRHPITNLPWLIAAFFLIIAPAFLSILPVVENIPGNFQMVFGILWYVITTAFILEKFLAWFFNVNIVTDERIIDVDFLHLVYREISDADIEQIQDVTVEMGGTIRTIFNYGDVLIQTAAEQAKTRFEAIPHPDRVAKILRELRVEEQEERAQNRVR